MEDLTENENGWTRGRGNGNTDRKAKHQKKGSGVGGNLTENENGLLDPRTGQREYRYHQPCSTDRKAKHQRHMMQLRRWVMRHQNCLVGKTGDGDEDEDEDEDGE